MSAQNFITHAVWLGDGLLLAVTSLPFAKSARVAWCKSKDIRSIRSHHYELPDGGTVWLVWAKHINTRPLPAHRLDFFTGGKSDSIKVADIPLCDAKTVARECFASLPASVRAGLLSFMAEACDSDVRIAQNLSVLRDILREQLVESFITPQNKQAIHIEQLFALSDTAFFIRGWLSEADAPAKHLRVCSPEGAQVELLNAIHRYERPDIARLFKLGKDTQKFGFVGGFELPAPSVLSEGWLAELHADGVEPLEAVVPAVESDPDTIKNSLFALLPVHGSEEFLRNYIQPAFQQLASRRQENAAIASVEQYGVLPPNPAVSIIITLESSGELIEHQLAQFANDPEVCAADILFVLSNPAAAESLTASASQLHQCYAVPFRLAVPSSALSLSLARNAGAAHALAPRLVFLSSSVFPDRHGWLASLIAGNPTGTAGAKLLREDDSIAHAGIRFVRNGNAWQPRSRFRGLQRYLHDACIATDAPALNAACFAISRESFDCVGGFSGAYVTQQLDDVDFFLRLAATGRKNRYIPDAELYHLPVLKKPAPVPPGASLYDAWLFERTHNTLLSEYAD